MSLISSRNFLAPFSNKVHIVTVVLGAIAFAVLRLSGGGVAIERTRGVQAPAVKVADPVQPRTKVKHQESQTNGIEGALGIDPVLAPWDKAPQVPKRAPERTKKSGAMDEIEKTLGMK